MGHLCVRNAHLQNIRWQDSFIERYAEDKTCAYTVQVVHFTLTPVVVQNGLGPFLGYLLHLRLPVLGAEEEDVFSLFWDIRHEGHLLCECKLCGFYLPVLKAEELWRKLRLIFLAAPPPAGQNKKNCPRSVCIPPRSQSRKTVCLPTFLAHSSPGGFLT